MVFSNMLDKPNNYAFIDSQNVNVSTQKFGWKMNWRELRKYLEQKYNVSKAFMFIGYVPEFEALYEQMREEGVSREEQQMLFE